MTTFISGLSGKSFPINEKVSGESIRKALMEMIQQDKPEFDASRSIALSELNIYREKYIADYLRREVGELSDLETKVLDSMKNHSSICCTREGRKEPKPPWGVRISDRVTRFGGSWAFVILFGSIIVLWMSLNIFWLAHPVFDPYPFVLLNLLLSYLSTLQAPVIMMSQNRQSAKDRERSKEDYMVNLKSEIEVRTLHEKLDHLMMYQQQELIEIQKIQIDMLNELLKTMRKTREIENREKKIREKTETTF
jgi:uncharacterized membrane protein